MKKNCLLAISSLIIAVGCFWQSLTFADPTAFDAAKVKEIQKIVHSYLVQNPQILREMAQSLRSQEMVKMQEETKAEIGKHLKELLNTQKHLAIGNLNGDIIMVEIFDYQCSHCKTVNSTIENLIKKDPNLQVTFLEWPIFGADSTYAAKAALASNLQGKYLAMHDALLDADNPLTKAKVLEVAKSVGLDQKKLAHDINDHAIDALVKDNIKLGQSLKLIATPAFIFINRSNNKFDFALGAVDETELRNVINKLRTK